ncbi:AAA-domain-containing protein [Aspergillus heteromorphus CBS 117.55]|uniref:AAA-domain-containing protein n=1 Tax=Aspergillus heteromorphus CBS 117.55 TaxID=1448321 RepID=A0A317V3Y3_9EURO|nr:AAA-domain-containing protein [Aspergillus heteromorphus CBS 117.55]PWY68051.1 AAA-domain-containing protein [Aspergillus heteromorphus CBS 117.55]
MSDTRFFTVRPLSKPTRNDHRDAFRVYMSSSSLAFLKLRAGDVCNIHITDGPSKTAIAWNATENIQNTVVQTSRTLQDCYGVKVGEKISISKADSPLKEVTLVSLVECSDVDRIAKYGAISPSDMNHWSWSLELPLSKCDAISTGLVFELELRGQRRSFSVAKISSPDLSTGSTLFKFTEMSRISMGGDSEKPLEDDLSDIQVQPIGLGGMDNQINSLNESLADFNMSRGSLVMPPFYAHSRGILLYGPKGTGKTALLQQIGAAGWRKTLSIGSAAFGRNIGDAEVKMRNMFQEAMRCQPSAIIIDQVEFIAPRRTSMDTQSLSSVLCECLDAVKSALVLVVAATRHPNDVDDALRTPHRLAIEIEMQIPTAQDRARILHAICGSPSPTLSDTLINTIAEKTHGYVGADLFALLQLICRKARQRQILNRGLPICQGNKFDSDSAERLPAGKTSAFLEIDDTDVLSAIQETRPTAMREVLLETPKVRWSDIGGQHEIKRRLQKAVERPLRFPERMKRLNLNSKKGILLYGPPGCSKTLTVKALATEAGLNFLAVKGAEILSMYVGESERALREIFRKARSARPSIIFFDEIDAIASKRGSSSQGGVNVLTTLLNEMDGIEELKSVLVVAATNKPEVIDPALMRPGRLDNVLYIGPPDFEARREILNIWFDKSVVHPEVEVDVLALKLEGYSGAEIVSICETAGDAALDEEEETGEAQDIRWRHFQHALNQVKRQITADVIAGYEQWSESVDF